MALAFLIIFWLGFSLSQARVVFTASGVTLKAKINLLCSGLQVGIPREIDLFLYIWNEMYIFAGTTIFFWVNLLQKCL